MFVFAQRASSVVLCLCGVFFWADRITAQEAIQRLPGDVNALLVIDVAAAYQSPLAQQDQWAKKVATSFLAQEVFLPPSAKRVTVGAQLDLNDFLSCTRQHVILEVKAGNDLAGVAALTGGEVEAVGDRRGLAINGGRYIVEAAPHVWMMAQPGGRQASLRWARSVASQESQLSPFLTAAAQMVTAQRPIVLALDLTEAVPLAAAKAVLEDLPGKPLKGASLDAAATVLAGAQGIVVKIHLGTKRTAQVRVAFARSALPLAAVGMPLAEAVLQQWGASLEDSKAWTAQVDGHDIVFDGELSATGMKRLISIVQPSVIPLTEGKGTANDGTAIVAASQKYLRSVRHELDSLEATLKRTRDNHALWFERSGKAIDGLPLKNVDPDLQVYGARVSSSLRYQAQAERMSNVRMGTRLAESKANTFYSGVGPYGEVYANYSPGNAPAINAEQIEASRSVRFSEWKHIEDGMTEIRRKLTQKYNEEF
ncbi:MAG TPA: hypothetical protein VFG20_12645 [Planctomycetaceae bacterium]|nr:hypothetical protein [Planctomycetaceae bacterium]